MPFRVKTESSGVGKGGNGGKVGGTGLRHSRKSVPARLKLAQSHSDHVDPAGKAVNLGPFEKRAAPSPPSALKGEALAEWNRVAPTLAKLGLLKPEDRAALSTYCMAWEMLVDPATSKTTWFQASRELRAWAVQFGLTPTSEQKLPTPEDADDPFADG
jgi:phage terminase small subunit